MGMVDKVADAIEAADGHGVLAMARAAIEAMREPTNEMKTCSDEVHWGYSCHTCGGLKEGWYAMIDAALRQPSH